MHPDTRAPFQLKAVLARTLLAAAIAATAPAIASAQADNVQSVSLAAGPLGTALTTIARQFGFALSVDTGLVAGRTAPALSGRFTGKEALDRVLAGSGLSAQISDSNVTVRPEVPAGTSSRSEATLATVQVTASPGPFPGEPSRPYAGEQVARGGMVGMFGNKDMMDTPFNQTSYTAQTLQDQQARTLADVLANEPSSSGAGLPRGTAREQPTLRGFGLSNGDLLINGLSGLTGNYSISLLDSVERVEILKGMTALLTGMSPTSGIAGTINLQTKRAADVPLTAFTASYASRSQFGGHLDIGRRFGDNNHLGIRFNGSYRDGGVEVDNQKQRLSAASLGLDYRGERVRASADLAANEERNSPAQGRPLLQTPGLPPTPDNTKNYIQPWSYVSSKNALGIVRGEVDVNDNLHAYASVGVSENKVNLILATPTVINMQGDYRITPTLLGQRWNNVSWQTGIRSSFATGAIGHEVNLTASGLDTVTKMSLAQSTALISNLYDPVFHPEPSLSLPPEVKTGETHLMSYGIADTMSAFDKRVQLTLGVRHQQVRTDSYSRTTGLPTANYDSAVWTPAVMLVVKPKERVSVYANYIEGLQAGFNVGAGFLNSGEVLKPFVAKQSETGVKVDWGRFTTTASLFQITQRNLITVNTAPLPSQLPNGQTRNRGLELNTFGEVTRGVRVLGGIMLIDPKLAKTQDGLADGNTAVGIPKIQANLSAEWDIPTMQGATLPGRVIHPGSQVVNTANSYSIPAWTRLDIGARYALRTSLTSKPVVLRLAVENVFNKNAWIGAAQADNQLYLLAPRTLLLSATMAF
ncbi:MAG TPA: TonB-dependent receptor [Burkholderiaceae bacterium]|nr:TonB-dependent receptor [Burkholderiaceae bacterium]